MLTVDFDCLQVGAGMRVLDAGCGQGRHSLEFLRRGCKAVAMDLNVDDLKYTRYVAAALGRELAADGLGPRNPAPVHFLAARGDALSLPFVSEQFDRVICSEVMEHVTDPAQAARELARVLKPGGLAAFSVPTPFTEWAYRYSSDEYFNTPGGHVRIFTPRSLAALLTTEGFAVDHLDFAHSFHSIYWWVRCVFGLHDETHPAILHFKKVLTTCMYSSVLAKAERLLDFVLPKSMVLYARRRE